MADSNSGGKGGSGYGLGLSTRTQVTGYQFLARRTAMALTRWRVRMEIEPGRRQTLAVVASVSAALVICLGALLWSFINPSGALNESPIIADRDSGALYVKVGDKLFNDLVWTYPDPIPECPKIKDYLCFFNEQVDGIFVDGVAQPRPVTPWSKDWKERAATVPYQRGPVLRP